MIGQPLTEREILALPPLIDLATAGRALTIGRSTAYALAAVGELPLPVLRIGPRSLRVRSSDLRDLLGLGRRAPEASGDDGMAN